MRVVLPWILVVAWFVVLPAGAPAQGVIAPPGLSGVDEYLETVPSADGPREPGGGKPGGGSLQDAEVAARADRIVGAANVAALKREGRDGERAAALAATGAPATPADGGRSFVAPRGSDDGRSAVGQVATAVTGVAGAGAVLPVGLLLVTLLLAAAALRRRRAVS
ncbi:hypothetical protein [Paraconexibacter sp.]|uniref:hypothetical protein n=1 Tax=Paraconexibacter sp. TaxID=2949640 RepID=UPI003565C2B0